MCVGGGLGVAPIYPQLRAFKESGAYVIGVIGFRNKELIFWREKFEQYCDERDQLGCPISSASDGSISVM